MKKIIAMILALIMVLSLAACGGSEKAPETKAPEAQAPATEGGEAAADYSNLPAYKLGIITPLTGAGAEGGVEYKRGAELALKHFGDTINGRKIELVIADGPNADASLSEYERLYDEGVRMFSSGYGSMADMGALSLADELETLYMGMTWSPDVDCSGSQYFFRLGVISTSFGADCINFAMDIGEKQMGKAPADLKVAIVYNTNHTPIAEAIKARAEETGVQVAAYEGYAFDTQDFVPTITKLQAAEYDILIPVQSNADCAAFQKKCFELGYKAPLTLAAGISYDVPYFAELGNEITNNVMTISFVNPTAPETACPGITRFVEDFKAEHGYMPLTHALMAYCQIQTQIMLLEQVSPDKWEDTALLCETFRAMDVEVGVMPWYRGIKFDEKNDNTRAAVNMVCQWQDGELVAVLPEVMAVGELRMP